MSSLKQLLSDRTAEIDTVESINSSLVAGNIGVEADTYFDTSGSWMFSGQPTCQDWVAPADGKAIIEIWGAGGSSGIICCCGFGIPGNAGAYVKTEICLAQDESVHYCVARGTYDNAVCCGYRGCATCFCVTNKACGYAEGGYEGRAICNNSGQAYCCAVCTPGVCRLCEWNPGCGTAINCNPVATGAVVDAGSFTSNTKIISGPQSCITITCCCDGQNHWNHVHMAYPGGIKGLCGGTVSFRPGMCNSAEASRWSAQSALNRAINGVSGTRRMCYAAPSNECGCYDTATCHGTIGIGVGAPSVLVCGGQRVNSAAGGAGAIRITFIRA